MITFTLIGGGSVQDLPAADLKPGGAKQPSASQVLWVDLDSPTEKDYQEATAVLGLSPPVLDSLRQRRHRFPHCTVVEGQIVLDTIAYKPKGLVTQNDFTSVTFLLGETALATVHHGQVASLTAAKRDLAGLEIGRASCRERVCQYV